MTARLIHDIRKNLGIAVSAAQAIADKPTNAGLVEARCKTIIKNLQAVEADLSKLLDLPKTSVNDHSGATEMKRRNA